MDILLSAIVSGIIWDIIKGVTIDAYDGVRLNESVMMTIDEKANEMRKRVLSYESCLYAVKSDEDWHTLISENIQYKTNFAKRLDYIIASMNAYSNKRINIEVVAEFLGHESANQIKQFYIDEIEPSFEFISETAEKLGVNEEWLKNGRGKPFWLEYRVNYPADIYEAVISTNLESIIFCLSEENHIGIILQHNELRYLCCRNKWHFNDNVGATGQSRIASIHELAKLLERGGLLPKCKVLFLSNRLHEEVFSGKIPATAVSKGREKYSSFDWLTDFVNLNATDEYGEHFKFCQNVVRCREQNS